MRVQGLANRRASIQSVARMTASGQTGAADQDRAPVARMACTNQGRSANVNAHAFGTDLHMHRSVRQTII